jgi:hypothetical protein
LLTPKEFVEEYKKRNKIDTDNAEQPSLFEKEE